MYPHFLRGDTGATVPFSRKDDGADVVESSLLFQGLLCVRAYFHRDAPEEARVRDRISWLWREAEWDWYTRGGRKVLTWHWSPNNGFALDHEPLRPVATLRVLLGKNDVENGFGNLIVLEGQEQLHRALADITGAPGPAGVLLEAVRHG